MTLMYPDIEMHRSATMARYYNSLFSSVGRAISGFGSIVATAREVQKLTDTPESVFRARGTTRDAAIRAAVKRL